LNIELSTERIRQQIEAHLSFLQILMREGDIGLFIWYEFCRIVYLEEICRSGIIQGLIKRKNEIMWFYLSA
jgi:hypothetical protein